MNVPLVVLIVLDGWGIAPSGEGNAVSGEHIPNFNKFWHGYPHTSLSASGESVGLPRGEAGNTETGHLNLGAGRIIYQDLLRINVSIAEGSFFKNTAFLDAINHSKKNNANLHLLGLVGGGSVHSNIEHLYALLHLCKEKQFTSVFLHLFTDGRDSPPTAAANYISQIEKHLKEIGLGTIASVMGRYWAMDRDQHWDRTQKCYDALTQGTGKLVTNIQDAIEASYKEGIMDEFINPILVTKDNLPLALIKENDSVIFYNFRIDRPRQLSRAFVFEDLQRESSALQVDFDPYAVKYKKSHLSKSPEEIKVFQRGQKIKNLFFVTMTQYEKSIANYAKSAFPPLVFNQTLGEVLATQGLRQLRLSESEKERFVTFYFSGQREILFSGEDRRTVSSKKVATYDLCPEMSAREITEEFTKAISENMATSFSFILINFANVDMVGHTGNIQQTKNAAVVVDECLAKIIYQTDLKGGAVIITADHGNAEQMMDDSRNPNTEHSTNPVPFIVIGREYLGKPLLLSSGVLADVAPTVLKLLGISKPSEMSGRSLL